MRRTANALAVETDEVPVSSQELLEANVAAIRADLTELKSDVRAIAAKADSELKTAVARIDEQLREVRQDTRELRAANETLRDKLDDSHSSLERKIDATHETLDAKIDATRESLERKIDAAHETLDTKIDATREFLDKKIDATGGELRADMKLMRADIHQMGASIADLKGMQKAILWILGGLTTVVTIVGGGLGIGKALGWM